MKTSQNVFCRDRKIILNEIDIDTVLSVEVPIVGLDESTPMIGESVETDTAETFELSGFDFEHIDGGLVMLNPNLSG